MTSSDNRFLILNKIISSVSVKNFDIIFKFEKGELVKQGKFNEIINDKFV